MAKSYAEKKLFHYMGKAISEFDMIQHGDRVMVCLSGGKDSYTLLHLLHKARTRMNRRFDILAFTLDQKQPGWDDSGMCAWLEKHDYPYDIVSQDTYSVVVDKIPEHKSYCSLCSRMRRGNIYSYAEKHGYNKIALGHHRDDLIESLLMSILYSGVVRSMPPKLLTDNKKNIVIRPLAFCQEKDIKQFAEEQQFPIIPCNLCGSQRNMTREKVKKLIADLAAENKKVPANILHAISNIQPSQLMDFNHWDFKGLDDQRVDEEEQIITFPEKKKQSNQ